MLPPHMAVRDKKLGKQQAESIALSGCGKDVFATLSGNSLRQTVHTHCASVHQAAKLVAGLRLGGK